MASRAVRKYHFRPRKAGDIVSDTTVETEIAAVLPSAHPRARSREIETALYRRPINERNNEATEQTTAIPINLTCL